MLNGMLGGMFGGSNYGTSSPSGDYVMTASGGMDPGATYRKMSDEETRWMSKPGDIHGMLGSFAHPFTMGMNMYGGD